VDASAADFLDRLAQFVERRLVLVDESVDPGGEGAVQGEIVGVRGERDDPGLRCAGEDFRHDRESVAIRQDQIQEDPVGLAFAAQLESGGRVGGLMHRGAGQERPAGERDQSRRSAGNPRPR